MRRYVWLACGALLFSFFVGCGGCDEDVANQNGGDALSNLGDGSSNMDGTTTGGDGSNSNNNNNNGTDNCPTYQKECGGKCVTTALDPNNCGSCGNTCSGSSVCNSGQCVSDCPFEMDKCGNRCVDLETDSDNCGMCGKSCPKDKACSNGQCVDKVPVEGAPAKCKGGGPDIKVGYKRKTMKTQCSGKLAQRTFRWGLCSCKGVDLMNNIRVDAFDSKKGPYTAGGYGGAVGTNGGFSVGKGKIFGALWAASSNGVSGGPNLEVKQQLHSRGDVSFMVKGTVSGDAWVKGNVNAGVGGRPGGGGGKVSFEKTLYIPQGSNIANGINTNKVVRKSVSVPRACNRCKKPNRIPVERIVKSRKNNNDNAAIKLDKNALDQPGKKVVLQLPCGEYYLSKVDTSSTLAIVATGRTAIYIDGNFNSASNLTIKPTPGAELDVFVNGKVTLSNDMQVGSAGYPASTRFYVNDEWSFMNTGLIAAHIYAVPGGITSMNELEIFGGIYTDRLGTMNNVNVHYDRAILDSGDTCDKPDPDPDNPDAGMSDGGGGKKDTGGGGGTTCGEKGQSCGSDGECCSPLVCSDGTCGTSSCVHLYENCSSNSECCSGICAESGGTSVCTGT